MTTTPQISVLIPTYNYAHYLDETIQSVLDQTFTDFELIIVDNCSIDNTNEVVKKYLSDDRVFFYRNEVNVGLAGNWNKCLEYAKGKYIKFLCADDKFRPNLLEKFVAIMNQYPNISLITTFNQMFGLQTRIRDAPFEGLVNGQVIRKAVIMKRGGNRLFGPTAVMFRKADVKKVGKFNPQLIALTDTEYWLRLLTLGDCYMIPEILCDFRAHEGTQTVFVRKKRYERIFEVYRFLTCVKMAGVPKTDSVYSEIDLLIKQSAIRCTVVMFKLLPKLYKKENRIQFRKAFKIGYSQSVLVTTLKQYLKWKYIVKLLKEE